MYPNGCMAHPHAMKKHGMSQCSGIHCPSVHVATLRHRSFNARPVGGCFKHAAIPSSSGNGASLLTPIAIFLAAYLSPSKPGGFFKQTLIIPVICQAILGSITHGSITEPSVRRSNIN